MTVITPPTPEIVAEMLCDALYIYGWALLHDGNAVRIDLGPFGDANEPLLPGTNFEAHVFAVESPAPPVAAEPVELDVKVARDLVEVGVGRSIHGWTVVDDEAGEARRWVTGHTLIIRNEAGEHFEGFYDVGLTEVQETEPWEYERVATFEPVEQRVTVVRSVGWVKPSADAGQDSAE